MQFQCKKLSTIFIGPTYKLLLSFTVISDVYRSFMRKKLQVLSYSVDFKAPREL